MKLIPGELQLFPNICEHNWLIHEILVDYLTGVCAKYGRGILIDIGCGKKPYKDIFSEFVSHHIGIDNQKAPNVRSQMDLICNVYQIGLENEFCDVVLCTEVLEHLEDPRKAMLEMNRILKDGGVVILTVPLFWPIHEAPRDYYRYTEHGLRFLFQQAGFEVIEIKPLTGFIVTFSQMSIYYFMRFQRGFLLRGVGRIINYLIQYLALKLNKYDRSTEFTNLYGLVAKKKSDSIETGAF